MVAPLIVGASRTVGTKVVKRSARDLDGGIERSRRVRKLEMESQGYQGRRVDHSAKMQNHQPTFSKITPKLSKKSIVPGGENKLTKRIEALYVCVQNPLVMWVIGSLWALQFCLWVFGIVGIGIEKIPGVSTIYPGVTFFEFSHIFIGLLGTITLIIIAGVFIASRVDCFSGAKLIIFALTFCLYWGVPFLGLFPWFGLWLVAVVYLQNED